MKAWGTVSRLCWHRRWRSLSLEPALHRRTEPAYGLPKSRQRSATRASVPRPLPQSSTFALYSPRCCGAWGCPCSRRRGLRCQSRHQSALYVVTNVKNRAEDSGMTLNSIRQPSRRRIGSHDQSGKLNTAVTFAGYTGVRCVLQVLLLIWEGRLPHGNQAHWGMDSTQQPPCESRLHLCGHATRFLWRKRFKTAAGILSTR